MASPLTPKNYMPRLIEERLDALLEAFGAVEIEGAKWCGKTWTALTRAYSVTYLDRPAEREAAELEPSLALLGDRPHLVDEWQEVPEVWDATRRAIDDAGGERGLFLLTGSSALNPHKRERRRHSGAGRIARLRMRPMSLSESGQSSGRVSLAELFEGVPFMPFRQETTLEQVARWCCQGGWPGALGLSERAALEIPAQYLDALLSEHVVDEGKSALIARALLQALAMNVSRAVTQRTLLSDMGAADGAVSISDETLVSYLEMLERLFVMENLPGWAPPLRDKARVRTKPKRYFVDPSLAVGLIHATPQKLLHDTQTLGELFENLCIRDLRVYLSSFGGADDQAYYYRDDNGLEVDIVLEHAGAWGAFEVKLSETKVEDGVANLLRLRKKLTANPKAQTAQPAFLGVITGRSSLCYQRPDGVYVIPLAALTA